MASNDKKMASIDKKAAWDTLFDSDDNEVSTLKKQAKDYTENTSIHGLVYLGESGRSFIERIFWGLFFIGSIILAVFLMTPILNKYLESPTIISPNTTNYPIWNIYFPAVTICSNNKLMADQFRKVLKRPPWINMSEEATNETAFRENLERAIETTLLYETRPDLLKNDTLDDVTMELMDENKKKLPTLLQQVMHKCKDMLLLCLWEGKQVNCTDIFEIRRTDNGYCCSFNTIKMSEQFVSPSEINTGLGEDMDGTDEDYYDDYYDDYGGDYDDYDFGDYDYYEGDTDDSESGGTTTEEAEAEDSSGTTTTPNSGDDGTTSITTENADGTESSNANFNDERRRKKRQTSKMKRSLRKIKKSPASSSNGNKQKKKKKDELRKTNAANSLLGLTVVLYANRKQYSEVVMNNFFGFKVLVHSPYDFPEVGAKGFAVGEKVEAFVAVGATETTSTPDVLGMPLAKRECLKHDENMDEYEDIVLQVFSNYSQKACYLECEARALMSKCGCLPYYFPDFSRVYKKDTNCNVTGLRCLANQYTSAKKLKPSKDSELEGTYCACPVECQATLYSQEMSQSDRRTGNELIKYMRPPLFKRMSQKPLPIWILEEKIKNFTEAGKNTKRLLDLRDDILDSASVVHFYFKERGIVQYSREQLYSMMDVIAAFGGVIGLCMGFSLLSGVELIYWFTLRLFIDQYRKKK